MPHSQAEPPSSSAESVQDTVTLHLSLLKETLRRVLKFHNNLLKVLSDVIPSAAGSGSSKQTVPAALWAQTPVGSKGLADLVVISAAFLNQTV